jgi:D-alanine-D-alanine ligase
MRSPPRVLVIFNQPVLPVEHPDAAQEHDVIESTDIVVKSLKEAGFPVRSLGLAFDPQPLLDEVAGNRPDVVFNMFEGIATRTETEISVAALLEWLGVPFTGSPSSAIALGRDKIRAKQLLRGGGVNTADFQWLDQAGGRPWPHPFPAIVKPALQDCSVGIEQQSVVVNQAELDARVALILERYGPPVLVEQFLPGREFLANVIEEPNGELLFVPVTELRFARKPEQKLWPIYSYNAKWNTQTEEFQTSPFATALELEGSLQAEINRVVEQAYRLVGLRDYGRVDLRLDEAGRPCVLEVNPNPYLHGEAIIDGLKSLGRSHDEFLANLVWAAHRRQPIKRP